MPKPGATSKITTGVRDHTITVNASKTLTALGPFFFLSLTLPASDAISRVRECVHGFYEHGSPEPVQRFLLSGARLSRLAGLTLSAPLYAR
jgi:hypothetical protein